MKTADQNNVFAIVLAGGEGKRLSPLTLDRAKPAVPFGGNYRLIDFALSNLVNAGYRRVVVLTQYKSHSLDRHISTTWRLSPLLGNYVAPGAGPDAPRPVLVPGLRRRHPPEPQPAARRTARRRHRVRGRPHLPHGPRADGPPAHRVRRLGDRGGDPGADRAGRPVRGHRDRGRRPDHHRLPREAQGRRRAARRAPTRSTRRWATTCSPPTRWSTSSTSTPSPATPRTTWAATSSRCWSSRARPTSMTSPPTRSPAPPTATAATGATWARSTPSTTPTWTSSRSTPCSTSTTWSGRSSRCPSRCRRRSSSSPTTAARVTRWTRWSARA